MLKMNLKELDIDQFIFVWWINEFLFQVSNSNDEVKFWSISIIHLIHNQLNNSIISSELMQWSKFYPSYEWFTLQNSHHMKNCRLLSNLGEINLKNRPNFALNEPVRLSREEPISVCRRHLHRQQTALRRFLWLQRHLRRNCMQLL